jgi:anti-sigma regulatory factor (Ser/Thr protein kinase)
MDKAFTSYRIEDRSYISFIKRQIHNEVACANFTPTRLGEIDIIVSEITSNIVKHAGNGELLYRCDDDSNGDSTFEIIAIDKGPGMEDSIKMMQDGVSTTKTLGQGLGAINRLSNTAQLYSIPGWGTISYALVRTNQLQSPAKANHELETTALLVNKPNEVVCGDGFVLKKTDDERILFLADGLGHGKQAKAAVDAAGEYFLGSNETEPAELLRQMHRKVRKTRGLVATIAVWNKIKNHWIICGVGNILTRMYTGINYKNYMPYNGAVGLNIPHTMNSTVVEAEKNQHLIMCSDGIQTRWDLNKYPAILKYDSTVLAAAIYKDFTRGNDDASVLIAKVC